MIVYYCKYCDKKFSVREVGEPVEMYEKGDYENVCPDCKRIVKWGIE